MSKKKRSTSAQIASPSAPISTYLNHPNPTVRRRAEAVAQLSTSGDLLAVAHERHLSPRLLASWQARFAAAGFEGLADPPLPAEIPASYWEALAIVLKGDPKDYGYGPKDGWTVQRLCDELECMTGIYLPVGDLGAELMDRGYKVIVRTLDRRSPEQKRFEAHLHRIGADHELQSAAQDQDATRAKVSIHTWRAPRPLVDRPPTEAELQEFEERIRQIKEQIESRRSRTRLQRNTTR